MFCWNRWCFTTCALFMVCLTRSSYYVTSSEVNFLSNIKHQHPKPVSAYGKLPSPRRSLTLNIDKETAHSSKLGDAEPGFDFNDEELKKLKIWPGGAIPYYIDEFSFDKVLRDRIRTFLDVTNSMTGVNFLELHRPPDDDQTRWVFFINRQGLLNCVEHPFKNFTNKGVQKILLGYDCLSKGGELAEMVLALVGVPPQHNAPNRNKYIEIVKDNIMPGKEYLFEILQNNEWLFHDIDYDFASASHYSLHKYTVNGKATIKPVDAAQQLFIGEAKGFSYKDIWKIRMIYNYVSKKRLKSISKPKCNELFNIATNYSNNVHDSGDRVRPRKKPNKYLGLPDKTTESLTDNSNGTKTNINNKEESEEDINADEEQDIENVDHKSDESKEKKRNESVGEGKDKTENSNEKLNEDVSAENSRPQSDIKISDDVSDAKSQLMKFVRPAKTKKIK